jgi:hypothetical protein
MTSQASELAGERSIREWSKCTTPRFYPSFRSYSTSPSDLCSASTTIPTPLPLQLLFTQPPVRRGVRPFPMLVMLQQLGQLRTQELRHLGPRREPAIGHFHWAQPRHRGQPRGRARRCLRHSQILHGCLQVPWLLQELPGQTPRARLHLAMMHLPKPLGQNKMR